MSEGTYTQGIKDPYWHLHDEDFETPYMTPRLTATGSVFMGGRDVVSLNGDWRFAIDPMREGLRQRWFEHDAQPIDGLFRATTTTEVGKQRRFRDAGPPSVTSGCATKVRPGTRAVSRPQCPPTATA